MTCRGIRVQGRPAHVIATDRPSMARHRNDRHPSGIMACNSCPPAPICVLRGASPDLRAGSTGAVPHRWAETPLDTSNPDGTAGRGPVHTGLRVLTGPRRKENGIRANSMATRREDERYIRGPCLARRDSPDCSRITHGVSVGLGQYTGYAQARSAFVFACEIQWTLSATLGLTRDLLDGVNRDKTAPYKTILHEANRNEVGRYGLGR